ncbi:hypothetical protein B0H14DRAFT_2687502 [Mycena olivaceomarginata]|nr:hypothetical protein B0H14DRAFT_2747584 [Mycena olivaceomarginata]KAJ7891841.1 hypothetical protein B0H14DRAFT_2687502 [Mycena olivaceomarginata]
MVYCYLVNSAFPSFDLMGPLLLGLGLSLGVTAIPSVTQFFAYLAASGSVFGGVFGPVAWVFSWAGLDELAWPTLGL